VEPLGPGLVGAQHVGSEQIQPDGLGKHLGQPAGFAGATGPEQKEAARKAVVNYQPPWPTPTSWAPLVVMYSLTKALIARILQQQGQGFAQLQSVAGGIGEEESALSSSESSLDSSAASRAFSFLS